MTHRMNGLFPFAFVIFAILGGGLADKFLEGMAKIIQRREAQSRRDGGNRLVRVKQARPSHVDSEMAKEIHDRSAGLFFENPGKVLLAPSNVPGDFSQGERTSEGFDEKFPHFIDDV